MRTTSLPTRSAATPREWVRGRRFARVSRARSATCLKPPWPSIPDYVDANLALGGWHADIDAEGFMARRMYGGKKEEAVRLFERALELAPESKVVLHAYAIRLPRLDEESGKERAREMLEKALGVLPRDAFEDYVHLDILEALDELNEG